MGFALGHSPTMAVGSFSSCKMKLGAAGPNPPFQGPSPAHSIIGFPAQPILILTVFAVSDYCNDRSPVGPKERAMMGCLAKSEMGAVAARPGTIWR